MTSEVFGSGDRQGTTTDEVPLRGEPAPPDEPALDDADALLVPPSVGALGLVTARSMDDALRRARR